MNKKSIAVAMSGGVDSSVVAATLKREGYQVHGITMRLFDQDIAPSSAVQEAKAMADFLDIPHHVADLRSEFRQHVITPFLQTYIDGRTPIPCVNCNKHLKFGLIHQHAQELGCDLVATGHYSRMLITPSGEAELHKGIDVGKDQSYFLFMLSQQQLKRTIFPLGELTKPEVRQIARDMGLPVAEKAESQEICFIANDDYAAFLADQLPAIPPPGEIINEEGQLLGTHKGIHRYTVGQRKGLGISSPNPLYVSDINGKANKIMVGERDSLNRNGLLATDLNWQAAEKPAGPLEVEVKIRNQAKPALANLTFQSEDSAHVSFHKTQQGVAPGQAAVFYHGDRLLGGGWIARSFAEKS
jgi:tRNA-specific 2-thiouridylase